MKQDYPRDLIGYGANPPNAGWPNGARIAVQFVLNYEEGGESSVLHHDAASEVFLSEIIGAAAVDGARHMSMESIYEYGSRVGVWRILDLFRQRQLPLTIFAVAMAAARNPNVIEAALADGHEIAAHGWRWINYHGVSKDEERAHMQKAVSILQDICGARPLGWYTGRTSENTRQLVADDGGFTYDADDYSDDLPFWSPQVKSPHLVVPYTLDTNDLRFATAQGFHNADQFARYLIDAFDVLYAEGATTPKMLSIGLHCPLIGRPARFAGLVKFLDPIMAYDKVWIARRIDIANHWIKTHPFTGDGQ